MAQSATHHGEPQPAAATATGFDHLVLSVADVEASALFYEAVLGMQRVAFAGGRTAVRFGAHKLNLNQRSPAADAPQPLDFCVTVRGSIEAVLSRVRANGVAITAGPVERSGAAGPITSVYVRDPDRNIIEIATYHRAA